MLQPNDRLYDVAIVGAGPIGLELAVSFQRAGADYIIFDAGQIGQTFTRWPDQTEFFSTPERIAIAGVPIPTIEQRRITAEHYLAYLRAVVEQFDIPLNTYEKVEAIERCNGGFELHTQTLAARYVYRARNVVVASGGMARPRRLNIPGENLPHVTHFFDHPHRYFRRRLLVVGGRNSAIESALRCWRAGVDVTISYRRPEISPEHVKQILYDEIATLIERGKVGFLPATQPVEITSTHVVLAPTDEHGQPTDGERIIHETDFVLLQTGYEADMSLLAAAGVELTGEEQQPTYNPDTMETNVPGLYVAGTAAAGTQRKFRLFIETSHQHVVKIVRGLTGYEPPVADTPRRNYGFFEEPKPDPLSHK